MRPHAVLIGSELIYYEQARTRTAYYLYPLPTYYFRLTTCDVLTTCWTSDLPYCSLPYCHLPYCYLCYCYLRYCYLRSTTSPTATSPTASRWRPCWLRRSSS